MRFLRPALFFLFLTIGGSTLASPMAAQEETLIFLVRHAERADDGGMASEEDPHLSEAGYARASALAEMLKDSGLTHIHSSDYIRTRETAAPAAEAMSLEVTSYNVRLLDDFAQELLSTPGRHLVTGHSNTTPDLVTALGGDPHGEIAEMEYDRLYILTVGPAGVVTVLLRFGKPFGG